MTSLNSITPDQESGVYAAALHALSSHIAEHHLAFTWIENPGFGNPLEVRVAQVEHHAWLATVNIVAEHNEPTTSLAVPMMKSIWDVRLPDTGTRIHLRTWRDIPFGHGPALLAGVSV